VTAPAGGDLRPWRDRLAPWLMALVRLGAAWLITARPLALLVTQPSLIRASVAAPVRLGLAAALGLGLAGFAWPRTYLHGLALLLAGLAAFEWLWRQLGLPPTTRVLSSVAILAVLAAGEWLTRRLERRR
jgi:hypothetical protein